MGHCYIAAAIIALALVLAQPLASGDVLGTVCSGATANNTYAANSKFEGNLKRLVATLPRNISSSGVLFATTVLGVIPDTVHMLLQCCGDISASACERCATGAFEDAQQLCTYNKDATVIYDTYALCYSNQDFFLSFATTETGGVDGKQMLRWGSAQNAFVPADEFDVVVRLLVSVVSAYAANSPRSYGTGVRPLGVGQQSPMLFALA